MTEKQTFVKKCKKIAMDHWACLPWFICGLENLCQENISKFEYFVCWISLLYLIWQYNPLLKMVYKEGGIDEDRSD